jgi:protein-tyrosine sulfotransferase
MLCGDHAYFVCIQRHGLDVACSIQELCDANGTYLRELHAYVQRHPRPLEAFCHAWVDVNRAMYGFLERHPRNAMLVKYEDLTADPASASRAIADFVGVEWTPDWLAGAMAPAESVGLGDWKTYGKDAIDRDGVGRWRRLSEHTIGLLGRICNPMLEASGYPPVPVMEDRTAAEARRRYELGLRMRRRSTKGREGA